MENISFSFKLVASCVAVLVTLFQVVSLIVIKSGRRVPANFRVLSMGLVSLDGLFMWVVLLRIWVTFSPAKDFIDRLCFTVGIIQYNTLSLITFERYFLFTNPIVFAKYFQPKNNRTVAFIFWSVLVVLYVGLRFFVCSVVCKEVERNGSCYVHTGQTLAALAVLAAAASIFCCVRIYLIIREKKRAAKQQLNCKVGNSPRVLLSSGSRNDEKCSYIVFLYTFTSLMGIFGLVAYLIRAQPGTKNDFFKIAFAIIVSTAIIDPCLYVFWFRECRLVLLKIFVACIPRLQRKVDAMRIEVFDIVTANKSHSQSI